MVGSPALRLMISSLLASLCALGVVMWHATYGSPYHQSRVVVLCTTSMIADLVKEVAGDKVAIVMLMGPGVDPHLYRASESDIHKLSRADIIFYNGLHLEGKIGEIFEYLAKRKKVVALADSLPKDVLLPSEIEGFYDPHIWHDVSLWARLVSKVEQSICSIDHINATYYAQRARAYEQRLDDLDNSIKASFDAIPLERRVVVTAHDAFSYFGKRYGIRVEGLQGMSTETEISPRDIQAIADVVVRDKIKVLFIENSISERNMRAVQEAVIARGRQVTVGEELFSDALGDRRTNAHTYIDMIKHNSRAILSSLTQK